MCTVAVTGAAGYLGGAVARAFAQQRGPESVRCLVRTQEQALPLRAAGFQVQQGDVTDPLVADRLLSGCSAVVHAAARLGAAPREEAFAVNVDATERLARSALRAGLSRFVLISSIEAYGAFAGRVLHEDEPFRPVDHVYAESKALGEQAVREVYRQAGSNAFTLLRPGMVYGPDSEYWTHRYLRKAQNGRIPVLGGGGRVFPVFEPDLVTAVLRATERDQAAGEAFNLVHDEGLTWWDWAEAHHRLAGRGTPRRRWVPAVKAGSKLRELTGRAGKGRKLEVELRSGTLPNDKARRCLEWSPQPFADAMASCDPLPTSRG
ncbi:NAD-dependent epimerase/dehydratase family protein [Kitasatospora sp. McL0602]|uniref:NAD-dependent epimerase/dehydratase family protein n=1 Tax=Kitasatospora sp. McL0602 TaxID=3439530 RepID=UPI003F8BB832